MNWVRDVTLDEERRQIRTGASPQVMTALRNMTIRSPDFGRSLPWIIEWAWAKGVPDDDKIRKSGIISVIQAK